MRLIELCRHVRAPRSSLVIIIIISIISRILTVVPASSLACSLPACAPPFLPLELLSLSNSTDAHT